MKEEIFLLLQIQAPRTSIPKFISSKYSHQVPIATNDDISGNHDKSNVYTALPIRSYLIIVEGSNTNDTGRFNLTLSISSESNASGTIAHEGSWAKEGCWVPENIIHY